MKDTKNLRLRLKYWRTRRAMNIRQLSKRASVSSTTIVRIEKDSTYIPRADVINSLAEALSINVNELLVDEAEEKEASSTAA